VTGEGPERPSDAAQEPVDVAWSEDPLHLDDHGRVGAVRAFQVDGRVDPPSGGGWKSAREVGPTSQLVGSRSWSQATAASAISFSVRVPFAVMVNTDDSTEVACQGTVAGLANRPF